MTLALVAENIFIRISTHTLTWSVTTLTNMSIFSYSNFNSHAHVERDELEHIDDDEEEYFNSHAHVERDIRSIIDLINN